MRISGDYKLPWLANHLVLVSVFLSALVLFHVLFVYLPKSCLTKSGWKRTDYLYLLLGGLGLLWSVTNNRVEYAQNVGELATTRFQTAYEELRAELSEASLGSIVCIRFQRSEYSPPESEFSRIQNEYVAACDWMRAYSSTLPSSLSPGDGVNALLVGLHHHPIFADQVLNQDFQLVDHFANNLEMANSDYASVQKKHRPTESEDLMHALAPFLLAVALALRITKVTGELRLDKLSSRAKSSDASAMHREAQSVGQVE